MKASQLEYKNQPEIMVEIAYALPSEQLILEVKVSAQITAEQAITASTILDRYPEIDLKINKIGVFGKLVKLDTALRNLDRVEIYRTLVADPKELRKQRVAKVEVTKKQLI